VVRRILIALSVCFLAAVFETLCAGTQIEQRFNALKLPAYSLPFWSWFLVGGYYYVMCLVVLYRILSHKPGTRYRGMSLSLVVALMISNALWNLTFFRPGLLGVAVAMTLVYALLACVLFAALWRLDRLAGWVVVPYMLYLIYVTTWIHAVWRLNGAT
jgi:tryptophan-rich sensory protein